MVANPEKLKLIYRGSETTDPPPPPPPLKKNFFDGIFEFVKASLQKQAKLLGVTMNKRLTLKHHMNNIMH